MMSKETAKKIIDLLFKLYDEDNDDMVINHHTKGLVLDFIGGEPFMNVETIEYATKISVGTTMPYVRWKDFINMKIVIPAETVLFQFEQLHYLNFL